MWTNDEIKGKILNKLLRLGKIKASHTSIDNLPKGFPKELRGKIKYIIKDMIRENYLLSKPTHYGLEISVNINKMEKIMELIEIFLKKE